MEIAGHVALVTGGSSGLGRATAEALLGAGASVVIADLASSPGEDVARSLGSRARFVAADVADESDVSSALDAAAEWGDIRAIVNCAGVVNAIRTVGKKGPFPLDEFTRVVTVNLIGTFNVIRLAAARMQHNEPIDDERGVIVNTASVAAFEGQIGQAAYSASKGGVAAMTLPVARDLSSLKIRVNAIAPGLFDTPMLQSLPEEARESLGRQIPHPARLGRPSEYAQLALAIMANPMINGEVIRLDGAIRMGIN